MVQIDKKDKLYTYLTNLGVDDVDALYIELASNGRYNIDDVRKYFRQDFQPSQTEDVTEADAEKVLDYYTDLKSVKHLNSTQIKQLLQKYHETKDNSIKELIINSNLKDILYLCLNYTTLHKQVDVQDLVQVANMGLLEAIEKYNTTAKIDFKDYVIYYVRKSVKELGEKNG